MTCAPMETLRIVCVLGRQCTYASFSGMGSGARTSSSSSPRPCAARYRRPRKTSFPARSPPIFHPRGDAPNFPADAGTIPRGNTPPRRPFRGRPGDPIDSRRLRGEHLAARGARDGVVPAGDVDDAQARGPETTVGTERAPRRRRGAELSPVVEAPRHDLVGVGERGAPSAGEMAIGLPALRGRRTGARRGERPRLGAGRRGSTRPSRPAPAPAVSTVAFAEDLPPTPAPRGGRVPSTSRGACYPRRRRRWGRGCPRAMPCCRRVVAGETDLGRP